MDPADVVEVDPPVPTGEKPKASTTATPKPKPAPPTVRAKDAPAEAGTKVGDRIREDPGYGNAAQQSAADKREEAQKDCVENRPPISKLLGVGGIVADDESTSLYWLVVIVAAVALAIAVGASYSRRRRRTLKKAAAAEPRGALETVSTIVAVFGGIVGLAVTLVPGIGIHEKPTPEATMRVVDVNARITRGEYADKTSNAEAGGARAQLSQIDERQVGNVIWLEIGLQGYAGRQPVLQYGLYDPEAGGALLPDTEKLLPLSVDDKDSVTAFMPIWVGYPKSRRFLAQFRLLEGSRVRQIAGTGTMRGSQYRYACASGQRAARVRN